MTEEKSYSVIVVPLTEEDGGGYLGFVPDLPGCMSDGETRQEAVANAEDAMEEWLLEQEARGVDIPVPGSASEIAVSRERKLLEALQALLDYRDDADERIQVLERQLTELIAVLKDNSGRVPDKYSLTFASTHLRRKLAH